MAVIKFLWALVLAAVLAALAALSGCSFAPGSGAAGGFNFTTPFGSFKGDIKIVPGSIPPPYQSPAQPIQPVPSESTATQPAVALINGNF